LYFRFLYLRATAPEQTRRRAPLPEKTDHTSQSSVDPHPNLPACKIEASASVHVEDGRVESGIHPRPRFSLPGCIHANWLAANGCRNGGSNVSMTTVIGIAHMATTVAAQAAISWIPMD
jgi:hypothetical protein